jgi:hypothetical protein
LARRRALRYAKPAIRAIALAAAVSTGVHASLIIDEPTMQRFDEALVWYGFALLALVIFAWDADLSLPRAQWRPCIAHFWSRHWTETVVLAAILGFAVFMRIYRLDSFPPSNGLAFEEALNGNVAYRILHGARPLFYPVRYLDAVGFWAFGVTTFGLRFFGVAMGIATVPIFYLLLRQLVRVPVALFGTALLAAAYWPSLVNRETSATTFFTMLLAYLLIRGLRDHSALMFAGVGVLAGLISYEYEDIKPVPFYVLGFLGAIAVRQIGTAARRGLRPARDATVSILRRAWRPALAFAIAGGIVAGPLIVGQHIGKDPYLASLHRQEADRKNLGTPGLFAPNWEQQVRWSVRLFRPLSDGTPKARLPLNLPDVPVLDPISGILLAAGVVYGAFTFSRPHRIFFLGWFVATLAGGALLLSNWQPWKFYTLVPVGFVLAAFLVDDLYSYWPRFKPKSGLSTAALCAVTFGIVAYVFFWNADVLFNRVASDHSLLTEYSGAQGQRYAMCDYLRSHGYDNFSYAFHSGDTTFGFWRQRDTFSNQMTAWGDWIFVCHDLQGVSLASPREAWPLRDVPSGPVTLAFLVNPQARTTIEEIVERGYPSLSGPEKVIEGPDAKFYILGYSLTDEDVRSTQGLYGEYFRADTTNPAAQRVDNVQSLQWADSDLNPPFTVFWRGLVYLDEEGRSRLMASSPDPAWISLDGRTPYMVQEVNDEPSQVLAVGWHTVEIMVQKNEPGGSFSLRWLSADSGERPVAAQDLFSLQDLSGWLHTFTFQRASGEEVVRQRVDSQLDLSARNIIEARVSDNPENRDARLTEETYSSRWSVDQSMTAVFALNSPLEGAEILIDGTPVARCQERRAGAMACTAKVALISGEHSVEVRLSGAQSNQSQWTGATLTVSTPDGPLPEDAVRIRPYPGQ